MIESESNVLAPRILNSNFFFFQKKNSKALAKASLSERAKKELFVQQQVWSVD
jgi:hypothetical protein